jgi:hypothetical protein
MFLLLVSCLAGGSKLAAATPIQLRAPQTILFGPNPLGFGTTYAIPCVTDWNGDGKKDLLVGYQIENKIAVYLNSGTDAMPVFTNVFKLQCYNPSSNVWMEITHPCGGCGAPSPWVCDYDNDGKRDLLVGAGHDGTVWLYRNTNTDAKPVLVSMGQLKVGQGSNATLLTVGTRSSQCVQDWDEDGLPDLIIGAGDGYVSFFKNTNSVSNPVYAPGVHLQANGVDMRFNTNQATGATDTTPRSVPRVQDWDGDGIKDLVVSSDTGVYWCRNTNNNASPQFQPPVALQAPNASGVLASIITGPVPGSRMRVCPVDWNSDGVCDVLMGNADGTIYYYEGYNFQVSQISATPNNNVVLQWNSAPLLKYKVMLSDCPDISACSTISNVVSGGTATRWTNPIVNNARFYRIQIQ